MFWCDSKGAAFCTEPYDYLEDFAVLTVSVMVVETRYGVSRRIYLGKVTFILRYLPFASFGASLWSKPILNSLRVNRTLFTPCVRSNSSLES